MLFCSFLCRGCTTAKWNFLISSARFKESMNQLKNFRFPFSNLDTVLLDSTKKTSPTFDKLNKIDEVWSGANSLFGEFLVCCHSKMLLPRQRNVTTSPPLLTWPCVLKLINYSWGQQPINEAYLGHMHEPWYPHSNENLTVFDLWLNTYILMNIFQ